MKKALFILPLFVVLTTFIYAQEERQEILLIGTMHTVPKIVKHSYKPMLRIAKKYNPNAIFMETPMANDDKSWSYLKNGWSKDYQRFYYLSDSLQKFNSFDGRKFLKLSQKPYNELTKTEIEFLIIAYAQNRDRANYGLMNYLLKYGIRGKRKPSRHEDEDLTYKLALANNLKIYNMDDQQTNRTYHLGWQNCVREGSNNGNNEINNALNRKDYRSAMIPAIFRKLGKHTNKRKSLERLHQLSAFEYVIKETDGCLKGRKYWHERNMRISKNIASQVIALGEKKNIVFIGASHIIGIEKELKINYPNLDIKLMNEL